MIEKNKDIIRKLHVLVQSNEKKKDETTLELFYKADELVNTLCDLLEDAVDTYDKAKDVLFAEAGLLKKSKTVDQLK